MTSILITIPWFHPAFKAGGPVQSIANMVNVLSAGYHFYIFCGDTDLNGAAIEVPERNAWLEYNDYTSVWYAPKAGRGRHLLEQVKLLKPDVLYMVGLYSWHFTLLPLLRARVPKKVLSVRGMLHPGALGQKPLKKQMYIKAMRLAGLGSKCLWQASDAAEAGFIRAQFPGAEVLTAGNFPRLFGRVYGPAKVPGSLYLVSIALISPMKNILMVLQALQQQEATIMYHICGPVKDEAYWAACKEAMAALPANVIVQWHGDVPPFAVVDKLKLGQVFILPSKSENYGHAIIEALSAGLPVITSHATPWNALQERHAGINAEPTVAALQAAIAFFAAMDGEELERYAAGAAAYAAERVDVERVKEEYGWLVG